MLCIQIYRSEPEYINPRKVKKSDLVQILYQLSGAHIIIRNYK